MITYTVTDADGATSSSTHTVTVGLPPAPVAVNDPYTIQVNTSLDGDVRTGDSFSPGSTFSILAQPANSHIVFNSDGTFFLLPNSGFVGTETFAYQITDPFGRSAVGIEVIRIIPPAFVAVADAYSTSFNTPLHGDASLNDTVPTGSTFIAITAPMHGTLAMNADGTYTYTPKPGFSGTDVFSYAVTDPFDRTRFATDTITVTAPPPPIAVGESYATGYATPVAGNAAAGDTFLPGSTFAASSQPTHGALVFNPDGTFTYTPSIGFAGTDTFTYRITDPNGNSATAAETINVATPTLTAGNDAFSGVYATPVAGDAANGDVFAPGSVFVVATPPVHGSVVMNPNGTYTYTPGVGFTGTDVFTYRVTDPTGQSATATDTIVITPPGLIAADDGFITAFRATLNGDASRGDTFAPGSVFTVSSPPTVGAVEMNPNGTFSYTPPPSFAGTVTFTYAVTDPTGNVATATETIAVTAPALIATGDTFRLPYGTALTGNVAVGDTYATGSVFSAVTAPANGSLNMAADGTFQYLPAAGYSGADTFVYRITDPTGRTVTATGTIVVEAPPAVHRCLTTFGDLRGRVRR